MFDSSGNAGGDVRVRATWQSTTIKGGAGGQVASMRDRQWREVRAASDGSFRLCGVPVATELQIEATGDSAASPSPTVVRLDPPVRYAEAEVRLEPLGRRAAVYVGWVLTDSTDQPVAGAQVTLPGIGRTTSTSDSGTFRLGDLPAGTHEVVVHRIGYAPLTTTVTIQPGQRREQKLLLTRVTTLDSVRVVESAFDLVMRSFEDHKRVGLGSFLTRADLAKVETLKMSAVLQSLRGIRLVHGRGTQSWVVRNRGIQSMGGSELRFGDDFDGKVAGARPDCYAQMYMDGRIVYRGGRTEPLFNVNLISPADLEAVEYYAGPSQLPGEYAGTESTCGVLVLWTRRSP